MNEQKPSIGRIVLVRPFQWKEEFPAIVTRVHSDKCINVRLFTDDSENPILVGSCLPQAENEQGFGWRWPPRV